MTKTIDQRAGSDASEQAAIPGFAVVTGAGSSNFISSQDIGKALKNSKWLILTIAVLVTLLGVAAAVLLTPTYRSEVLVSHVSESDAAGGVGGLASQFSGIAGLAGISLSGGDSQRPVALATLKSREFTTEFIKEFNLKPRLFEERWSTSSKEWLPTEEPPTDMEAYKRFDKLRRVSEDKATTLISISITWKERHEAAEWANKLVANLNRHLRQESIGEAETSISYLRNELDKTSMLEMRQIIFGLIENQINQIMLASVRNEYSLKVIDTAAVADVDDYASPSKIVIVIALALAGLVLGVFVALVRYALSAN